MSSVHRFEDLEIWQMAREVCREIFIYIERKPFKYDYKLKDQIKGSSGSVMDNIDEGFERNGNKEFVQFLFIAKGSAGEKRSQLYQALDQAYLSQDEFNSLYERVNYLSGKIGNFINYLQNSPMKGAKYKTRNTRNPEH